MTLCAFLLALGACLRVTRFVTADLLAEPIRTRVDRWRGADSKASYLIRCPWCLSIYIAAAIVPAAIAYGRSPLYVGVTAVLTLSYLAGLAATLDRS